MEVVLRKKKKKGAEKFFAKARELDEQASRFQKEALAYESLSIDTLSEPQSTNEKHVDT